MVPYNHSMSNDLQNLLYYRDKQIYQLQQELIQCQKRCINYQTKLMSLTHSDPDKSQNITEIIKIEDLSDNTSSLGSVMEASDLVLRSNPKLSDQSSQGLGSVIEASGNLKHSDEISKVSNFSNKEYVKCVDLFSTAQDDLEYLRACRAYVSSVTEEITRWKLEDALEVKFGDVLDLDVIPGKCCAFVQFASKGACDLAIKVGFVTVQGRNLRIEKCKKFRTDYYK
ncbi:4810_t:CDS:2 [Acaulospora morrowiae]|uniref:4810_t:CDS:1 n=1 Tax=Acaulospora morrowiae TaxID=94023 RepID=A0A9N9GA27_9GLOM|nr:4810_t:CDS:2 [Acaulospora morrowiae]